MGKTIILIHGRNFKPPEPDLRRLWLEALRFGLQRDFPGKLGAFDAATISFVYFGHISNAFLTAKTGEPAPGAADVASRQVTLDALKQLGSGDFTKANYNQLPEKEALKEGAADVLGPVLSLFGLSDRLITKVAPDVGEYWNEESEFGTNVRFPMMDPLKAAMDRNDSICVIGHSLGTMIAWDTFWKFSHMGEYRPRYSDKKVDLFLTLGSPLADETVMRNLKGADISGDRRFPRNVRHWVNVAAEDDYISHDEDVANDYRRMLRSGLVESITDEGIYNLSVRDGKSNPHHENGYLIHPVVTKHVAAWLG
jgi:hypothetical protein